jgi:hypothetical protein
MKPVTKNESAVLTKPELDCDLFEEIDLRNVSLLQGGGSGSGHCGIGKRASIIELEGQPKEAVMQVSRIRDQYLSTKE